MKTVEVDEAGPHLEDLIEAAQHGEHVVLTRNGKPVVWLEPIGKAEIVIKASGWRGTDDFYNAFLAAVGAPRWHGHNLDALWDSLTGGDVNGIKPPYRVRITDVSQSPEACKKLIARFAELIDDAKSKGIRIDVVIEQ
jgi:prevent-host-death family protein